MLDLDTATPLGLMVAELIANSQLHAFPEGSGKITVSLLGRAGQDAVISFVDDGAGFTATNGSKRRGLGLVKL
jgi:two-component sensor histidine kinase